MRYSILLITILLFSINSFAQQKREHFRGGMFPHIGFLFNQTTDTKISGFCSGIGGKLVFPVTNNLRIGTEGYVTSYNYKQNEGFYKIGWGGLLVEYEIVKKKLMPVVGLTIGGGGVNDLYPVAGDFTDNTPDIAVFKKYSSMVLAPQISLEYSITSHINLATKVDYLLYPGNSYPSYIANGPRFYLGVLFSR